MTSSINNRFKQAPMPRTDTPAARPAAAPPPVARKPAQPTVDFNASSFKSGVSSRGVNLLGGTMPQDVHLLGGVKQNSQTPTPVPTLTPGQTPTQSPGGVQQTGGIQGDGTFEEGEFLRPDPDTARNGLNRRMEPALGDDKKYDTGFEAGTTLRVVTPDDGPPVVRNGFVYVEGPNGDRGWVSEDFVQELPEAEAAPLRAEEAAIAPYRELHVNQVAAQTEGRWTGTNGNCGPSSMVMAFELQGIPLPAIPGLAGDSDHAKVQAMRFALFNGVEGKDGVSGSASEGYTYNPAENGEFATFNEMYAVADAAEANPQMLGTPPEEVTADDIKTALDGGSTVIVSGTFEGKGEGNPWGHYDTTEEHIIAVVDTTPEGNFVVCDPAHPNGKPIVVTPEQLESFMTGNAGAMSIGPVETEPQPQTVG